ncbi:hypothetical protein JW905_08680, partial [bacterium]|nr:hypothetical protein [candidate division CSSED10-310 bacterium]
LEVDVYIALDVYGSFWFWPGWTQELDFLTWTIDAEDCRTDDILEFTWPDGAGAAEGIMFWTAMFTPGTFDLVGQIGWCDFSYE